MPVYKNVSEKIDKKTGKERSVTTYYVSVRYKDWEGKNQRHMKRGFTTKKEAKEYEAKFISSISNNCSMLFEDLVDRYIENKKLKNIKLSTLENKLSIINSHIIPTFGKMTVDAITPIIIQKWQKKLMNGNYAKTYLYLVNSVLKSILNYAVRYLGLAKNPIEATETVGKKHSSSLNFWTLEEFNKFMNALLDEKTNPCLQNVYKVKRPVLALAFKILFYTGLRKGELFALTANDIDFENKTITINKTYTRLKQTDYITTPKTVNSNRVLTITDALAENLKEYIEAIPNLEPTDRIFETINSHSLRRALDYTAKAVGLKRIRVHDLRHSCCSLLFHLGCTPLEVKTYLGHKNIQITLNIYAHLYPEALDDVSKKIQAVEQRYQNGITNENE